MPIIGFFPSASKTATLTQYFDHKMVHFCPKQGSIDLKKIPKIPKMGQNVIIDRSIIHFSVARLKNCDIDISILGPPNFLRCTLNSFFQYPRSCGFEINHGS